LLVDGRPRAVVIDETVNGSTLVPRTAFADFWRRLGKEVAGQATVVGLGLMNEPHDMGHSDWKAISQAAVDAIRQVNQEVFVVVGGDGWSNAHRFAEVNGPRAWVRDPANRVVYEAHCYFDADASGNYANSFASELRDDPQLIHRGAKRLRVFVEWCKRNGVPGLIGEFGIPGDSGGWHGVLANALEVISQSGVASCYWAAGEWWNDYPLSIQPRDDMRQPAPQQQLLLDYLGPRTKASVPAAVAPERASPGAPS
jgi:endoglucanase